MFNDQKKVEVDYNTLAPDGSEIRYLSTTSNGSMVHCTLPPAQVSAAIKHQTVEELWFILSGEGQLWRKWDDAEEVIDLIPNSSITIPLGVHFQFRCTSTIPLCFIIVTLPPWPGSQEAIRVADYWPLI